MATTTTTSLRPPSGARLQRAYQTWRRRYPAFDPEAYARWVNQRGYHRQALDPLKPDFYEYATVFICKRRA